MQSGDGLVRQLLEHHEMQHVDMEMQDIELLRTAFHFVEHREVSGKIRFERSRVQSDRLIAHHDQLRFRAGVCRGEQRDLVPEIDQGIRQVCDHPLGSTIELRRHGFIQGRNLRDSHRFSHNVAPVLSWTRV